MYCIAFYWMKRGFMLPVLIGVIIESMCKDKTSPIGVILLYLFWETDLSNLQAIREQSTPLPLNVFHFR